MKFSKDAKSHRSHWICGGILHWIISCRYYFELYIRIIRLLRIFRYNIISWYASASIFVICLEYLVATMGAKIVEASLLWFYMIHIRFFKIRNICTVHIMLNVGLDDGGPCNSPNFTKIFCGFPPLFVRFLAKIFYKAARHGLATIYTSRTQLFRIYL